MPQEENLSIDERLKVIRRRQHEYREASRDQKSAILDHLVAITGLNRKTDIRRLNSDCQRKVRRQQRGRSYDHRVYNALRVIRSAHRTPRCSFRCLTRTSDRTNVARPTALVCCPGKPQVERPVTMLSHQPCPKRTQYPVWRFSWQMPASPADGHEPHSGLPR